MPCSRDTAMQGKIGRTTDEDVQSHYLNYDVEHKEIQPCVPAQRESNMTVKLSAAPARRANQ